MRDEKERKYINIRFIYVHTHQSRLVDVIGQSSNVKLGAFTRMTAY